MKEILSQFGIVDPKTIKQIYKSAWSIEDRFILKKSSNVSELNKSIEISEFLTSEGIPVASYIKTTEDRFYIKNQDSYYCLMNKIPGSHMDPFIGDCYQNGKTLGGIIAKLHLALSKFKPKFECYEANLIQELTAWVMPELEANQITFREGVIESCYAFEPLYLSLPRQLIHRDMHTGNLMFESGSFTGYLDFDISQRNIRVFDLCYLGCSLLVENYQKEEKLHLWKKIFSGIWKGYDELSPLNEDEKRAVPAIFVFSEVIFTAFFSKIGRPELSASCVAMTNWLFHNEGLLSAF